MKKNTVKAIFLGILALVIVAGFAAEIVLAAGRAAPWYIFFWSILTPVVALYFVIKRLLSVLKNGRESSPERENPTETENPTKNEVASENEKQNEQKLSLKDESRLKRK